jgi:hypothetical protein
MGITPKDIAAQRAMIARGEALAAVKNHHAERVRLRDEFAAAALTGLLADDGDRTEHAMPNFTARAYEWADAMLLQRNGAVGGCGTVQCNASVGVAEMDSVADRKSVATPRACARSCSQPFDSAPTTHDAVPDAKATNDGGTPKDADGTGNTQRPVAWARFCPNGGPMSVFLDRPPAVAEPLYRSPTLTESEREAIEQTLDEASGKACAESWVPSTLRRLLERLE